MTNFFKAHKHHIGLIGLAVLAAAGIGIAAAFFNIPLVLGIVIVVALLGVIIKNPLLGMYLLIFFLPFERIGSVDVGGATIRISQVIAIITVGVWLLRGFGLNKFKLRPNPIILPVLLFLGINVLGLMNTDNIQRSALVFGFTVFTMIVAIAIPNIIRQPKHIHTVVNVLLAGVVVVCVFGIYQFVGDLLGLPNTLTGLRAQYTKDILGFPRVQSTALEPLYFANYLLIPLSVALAFFLHKTSALKPAWLLAIIALATLNLVLTVSRGGYIAFAVVVGLLAIWFLKDVLRPRVLISSVVILALVGIAAFRFLNAGEQLTNYIEHVGNIFGGASYVERVDTFETAYTIWLQHPWIGIGPGGFGPYAAYHPLITPSEGFRIVNNVYIELLAETGTLGFIVYSIIVLIVLTRSFKAWRVGKDPFLKTLLAALTIAYVGILVQYNTFSVLYIMHIWVLIGLIIAVQNLLLSPPAHEKK